MQHVRNGLIIFLTNSLKNIINFVKTNLTPKIVINSKNRGPRSKLPRWTKIIFIYTSKSRARIRKKYLYTIT